MLKNIDSIDQVILLDEKWKSFSSINFSNLLNQKLIGSNKKLVFVIGGAFGFSEEVYKRANSKLSLSKMTFSHQMIRLIFKEQLYRAFTILKGEKYHHEWVMVIFSLIHCETQLEKTMTNIALKFLVFTNRINIYNMKLSPLPKMF